VYLDKLLLELVYLSVAGLHKRAQLQNRLALRYQLALSCRQAGRQETGRQAGRQANRPRNATVAQFICSPAQIAEGTNA